MWKEAYPRQQQASLGRGANLSWVFCFSWFIYLFFGVGGSICYLFTRSLAKHPMNKMEN